MLGKAQKSPFCPDKFAPFITQLATVNAKQRGYCSILSYKLFHVLLFRSDFVLLLPSPNAFFELAITCMWPSACQLLQHEYLNKNTLLSSSLPSFALPVLYCTLESMYLSNCQHFSRQTLFCLCHCCPILKSLLSKNSLLNLQYTVQYITLLRKYCWFI